MLLSWYLNPTICIFSKAEVEAGNPSEGSRTPCHHACLKVFQKSKAVFSSLISPYKPHIPMHNCRFVLALLIFSLFSKILLRSLYVFCQAAYKILLHPWFAAAQWVSRFVWTGGRVVCMCPITTPCDRKECKSHRLLFLSLIKSVLQVLDVFCGSIFHLNYTSQL